MTRHELTSRISYYSFDDMKALFGVNALVSVIEEPDRLYVIDTYLGNAPMREIMQHYEDKPVTVINTHCDWDHIWGNGYFDGPIYASKDFPMCFSRKSAREFKKYKRFHREVDQPVGADHLVLDELKLGNLLLFNTPGHTRDSLTVYDEKDRVLFPGDNLFTMYRDDTIDPAEHLASLKRCLQLEIDYILPGHVGVKHKEDLVQAIRFLEEA